LVLQVASGRRPNIQVFGQDYETPDGTCVRDYIHVVDLCEAHLLALDRLRAGGSSSAYNLGNGNGFSVKVVLDCAEQVTGTQIARVYAPRRAGDPAKLVADSRLARSELGWAPCYDPLQTIIAHAWAWEQRLCGGR
jgi:UDP-glucose 4-epimerase